ncbi:Uma2 family endonuclease, partial [Klebsiella pneumoniae]
ENALLDQAPADLDVLREMTIRLDERNRPEPDVLVFPAEANTGPRQTWFRPEDVVLAVEVVSDDSVQRDREVKPRKYAAAGVRHFWRVEADE